MASPSKPMGVHIALIVFVMISLISGVVAYMMYSSYEETETRRLQTANELEDVRRVALRRDEEITELKKLIGHEFEDVGLEDRENTNTVLGAATRDINDIGGPQAEATLVATVRKLRDELDKATQERNSLQAELNDRESQILSLSTVKQAEIDTHQEAYRAANRDLQDEKDQFKESLDVKENENQELRTNLQQVQVELQQTRETLENTISEKDEEITKLVRVNDQLRHRNEEILKVSFDRPDGQLSWLDQRTRLVWINLGEADNLSEGVRFSVYTRGHDGVGRGREDIKGAIQVVRVLGPHRAEARILDDDLYRPMAKGDPIYTPLWNSGHTESFSFVGKIDLTGDGRSDRDLLQQILDPAAATIDNQVDDDGNRVGDGIDHNTKFLVVGELPDPATVPPGDREAAEGVLEHFSDLQEEARLHAVRIVKLSDFLSYIGYKPTHRSWRPGQQMPYTLEAGTRSTAVKDRARRASRQLGSGSTSELFRGGGSSSGY